MDHLTTLAVLVGVVVIAVAFSSVRFKLKLFSKMEIELEADRKNDKKEEPGCTPDSSSEKTSS